MRPVNRIQPLGPARAYRTFQIVAPPDKTVAAACEKVGCQAWLHGWDTVIDESTQLGAQQAAYIRTESRRTFRETRRGDGMTVFRFESRQRCFAEHRTRPEIYLVKDGDWRQSRNPHRHAGPADWVEDFSTHQDQLATRLERG